MPQKTKLNVHLLRPSITDISTLTIQPKRAKVTEHLPDPALGFPVRFFTTSSPPSPPRWAPFVEQNFPGATDALKSAAPGAILLVGVEGRVFAITFGQGGNALPRDLIDVDFGLRVVCCIVADDKFKSAEHRSVDSNPLQGRKLITQSGLLAELEVDTEYELIRKLRGSVGTDELLDGTVEGGDSVHLSWSKPLNRLDELCAHLLKLSESKTSHERFPFLHHWREVRLAPELKAALEAKVRGMIAARETGRINLAFPDLPDSNQDRIRFSPRGQQLIFEELSLKNLYAYLDYRKGQDLKRVWVEQLDDHDAVIRHDALWQYVVAEVDHDGDRYLLVLDRWYRVAADFAADVDARVRRIPDVTHELTLPPWAPKANGDAVDEGEYNELVASSHGYLLLDKVLYRQRTAREKVEIADLLSPGHDLICVKKMSDSARLNHLWAQGSVSARLLNTEPKYLTSVSDAFQKKFGLTFDRNKARFVFGVAVDHERKGDLTSSLFFMTKIALLMHEERIRLCGFKVALCRIDHTSPSKMLVSRKKT